MLTRKEWLFKEHGVGKGAGKGRISAEGHALVEAARKAGVKFKDLDEPKPVPTPRVMVKGASSKVEVPKVTEHVDPKALRKWAAANGKTVPARGRIGNDLKAEYLASVPKEERKDEGTGSELDVYRSTMSNRYPEGTTFKAEFTAFGKDVIQVVTDRTCCYDCGVSLSGHMCDSPKIVTGYGADPVAVTVQYPKG